MVARMIASTLNRAFTEALVTSAKCIFVLSLLAAAPAHAQYFEIRVVDREGERVPCVELSTTNSVVLRTDANGAAAFYEPELMGRAVWFGVSGPHIDPPRDGFGIEGATLNAVPGGSSIIEVERTGEASCEIDDRETRRIA